MTLIEVCRRVLEQLTAVTRQLSPDDFVQPSAALNQSTVGQHLRHTLEFFLCLERGLPQRLVNYDLREHNELIQNSKEVALAEITRVSEFLCQPREDFSLSMQVSYDRNNERWITVESSYCRELIYTIEHAVHHMALMKVAIREVAPYVRIPEDFGIAVSTLRHQESVLAAR